MESLMVKHHLDDNVFRYYHPKMSRSGIVYINEQKIELLEKNRLEKTQRLVSADYCVSLDIVRKWVFG